MGINLVKIEMRRSKIRWYEAIYLMLDLIKLSIYPQNYGRIHGTC